MNAGERQVNLSHWPAVAEEEVPRAFMSVAELEQ